jgi:hypothetical protein
LSTTDTDVEDRIHSEPVTPEAAERAERFATMVRIRLERNEFPAAHAAIAAAEKQYLDALNAKLNPSKHRKQYVAELGLEIRIANTLERYGVLTVDQLAALTEGELFGMAGFHVASIEHVKRSLAAVGRELNQPEPEPEPEVIPIAEPPPRRSTEFGENVRTIVQRKGMTLAQLGVRLSIPNSNVHKLLKTTKPRPKTLARLSRVLGVPPERLYRTEYSNGSARG